MLIELLKAFRHNELYWFMKELISKFQDNCDQVESLKKDVDVLKDQVSWLKNQVDILTKPTVKKASKLSSVPTTKKATKKD